MTEFESATSSSQATRSSKLSYIPILGRYERIELSSSRPQRNALPLNQYLLVDPHRIELHPLVLQTSARTSYAKDPSCSVIQPNGGAKGDRTLNLLRAKQALSRLSYSPKLTNSSFVFGARCRARTYSFYLVEIALSQLS